MKTEIVYAQVKVTADEQRFYQSAYPKDQFEKRIRTLLTTALVQKLMDKVEICKHTGEDIFEPTTYSAKIVIETGNEDEDN